MWPKLFFAGADTKFAERTFVCKTSGFENATANAEI